MASTDKDPRLKRQLGVFGATMMGLGAIVGTGVFVSTAVAAGLAGPAVILAVVIAGAVAACNALSSAQLAANHPVSGGTYEYGHRFSRSELGFLAGWMFLCAKSASAATAALGFSGYFLTAFGADGAWTVPVAAGAAAVLTALVIGGIRRSSAVNIAIVSVTLATLAFFVVAGLPRAFADGGENLRPFFDPAEGKTPLTGLLGAAALMFVAYTGYGRIATLGEEVREPRRIIPRAIASTLGVSLLLYVAVSAVGVAVAGSEAFAATAEDGAGSEAFAATAEDGAAPLETIARSLAIPGAGVVLAAGAITAMLGVLLNLILGLSRVLLAMGRRGEMPPAMAKLDRAGTTPWVAVLLVGAVIAALTLVGDVKITWSFSAVTVLIYYASTNYCALRLTAEQRLYPRWISAAGLVGCLGLAVFVEWRIWVAAGALIVAGFVWRAFARPFWGSSASS